MTSTSERNMIGTAGSEPLLVNRRTLLGAAASALVIPFVVISNPRRARAGGATQLDAYLQIDAENRATVFVGSCEMGQGTMTGLAQIVAEELQLDWSTIRVEHGVPVSGSANAYRNPKLNMHITGGSTAIWGWYAGLRDAAAIARGKLVAAGSAATGATLTVAGNGYLTDGARTYPYSDFVADAASLPASAPTWAASRNYIGKSRQRVDIPSKTDGSAIFGMDVRVPNMLYAAIIHCPTNGGKVQSAPSSASGAVAVVNLGDSVGVVAGSTYAAMSAARSLESSGRITWKLPTDLTRVDTAAINAKALSLSKSTTAKVFKEEEVGAPDSSYAASSRRLDLTYTTPNLAHACMEVLNCTADVRADSCELWVPTQAAEWCLGTAMAITGLAADRITVNTTFLGGGFGRKIEQDYVSQAVTLSKTVGRPVKLMWSREQDFRNDRYRPASAMRVRLGADASGAIKSFIFRNVSTSINVQRGSTPGNNPEDTGAVAGAANLPYAMQTRRVEFVHNDSDLPLGYWRSVGESYNTFAVESAIDEMAKLLGKDPMAYRKQLLAGDARAVAVLDALSTLSKWNARLPSGTARGMAFLKGFFSYAAAAVELKLVSGRVSLSKVYCAVDCGVAINPDSIRAQIEGGILHGMSAALWHEVTFTKGKAAVSNFDRYKMAKMADVPVISVQIVESGAEPGGIGELGVPCVAPAIANAHAKLATRRRNLPFYPGLGLGEIEDDEGGDDD